MTVNKNAFDMPAFAHLKCVYSDPNFQDDIDAFKKKFDFKPGDQLSWEPSGYGVRQFLLGDEAVKRRKCLPDGVKNELIWLADKYDITWQHVLSYMNGRKEFGKGVGAVVTDMTDDPYGHPTFEVLIRGVSTKQEALDALNDFDWQVDNMYGIKTSNKKQKGPHYPQLVYAVGRQRKAGKTFKQIHQEYMLGKLKGYAGPRSMTSPDKFRQYYFRYRPQFDDVPI